MRFAMPFTVLDGGLSTALELRGHDLRHDLWTARLLARQPDAIVEAHLDYLRAGAEILITSSYQASMAGLGAAGHSRAEAAGLIGLTTELARLAIGRFLDESSAGGPLLVAASVGPYGAVLADGSEYRGDYSIEHDELVEFHQQRLEILIASEPDLLACETIPSLAEARALAAALSELPELPCWLTFSCRDGSSTCAGDPIEAAVAAAAELPGIAAVGVNCTDPRHVGELLGRAATVTDLPLVVYANSGQQWDGDVHCWTGEPGGIPSVEQLGQWVEAGARLIGGCCGVGPLGIAELRNRRDDWFHGPDAGGSAVA